MLTGVSMDDKLQNAIEFAKYKHTLNNQLHKLRMKAEGLLMIAEAGGQFTIDRELICFLDYLVRNGYTETTLLDNSKTPVLIQDTVGFLKKITVRYFEVTNDYLREAHIIKQSRNVKSILDVRDI